MRKFARRRRWLSSPAALLALVYAAGLLSLTAVRAEDEADEAHINQDDPHIHLTRGPYLMVGTPTGVTIRWRTTTAEIGTVWYGTDLKKLAAAKETVATQEHEIALAGLQPATLYYYQVGAGDNVLAGKGGDCHFTTHPRDGTAQPVRFWAVGDSGTADGNAMAVRNAFRDRSAVWKPNLWLMLGDNAYVRGTDTEYQSAVFDMYAEELKTCVVWPTRGNHDVLHDGPNNDYYEIFTLPTKAEAGGVASGSEAYYSFNYAKVHFICLDSEGTSRAATSPMWTWLKQDLAAVKADWIVAYFHHPPYSKGSHDSDTEKNLVEMREQALPILEAGGVDLVLCGHSHSYERSVLLDGHYGPSNTLKPAMIKNKGDGRIDGDGAYAKAHANPAAHEGAVYVVAGSSGKISGGPLNHPAMFINLNELGSVAVDINGNQLDATFLEPGGKVGDRFRILKGGNGKDTTPPQIAAVKMVDAMHCDVAFTEKLDPKTAGDVKNYRLIPNGQVGQAPPPVTEAVLQPDGQTVRLTESFGTNWIIWNAAAPGVTDIAGNKCDPKTQVQFSTVIPPQTNISFGSVWKYEASGTDLKEGWLKADYDDSQWPEGKGQLGYGDEDEATEIPHVAKAASVYFRRKLQLAGTVTAANLTLIHDDGVIVWINGKQVFSKYCDKGAAFDAVASKQSEDNETSKAQIPLQPNPFVIGENVICVMVKNVSLDSSDLSFDLQLQVQVADK